MRMLRILPPHYQLYAVDLRDHLRRKLAGISLAYDPLDQDLALQELRTAGESLAELWEEIVNVDPDYVEKRRDPRADVDTFVNALTIEGLPARPPVKPVSILRFA